VSPWVVALQEPRVLVWRSPPGTPDQQRVTYDEKMGGQQQPNQPLSGGGLGHSYYTSFYYFCTAMLAERGARGKAAHQRARVLGGRPLADPQVMMWTGNSIILKRAISSSIISIVWWGVWEGEQLLCCIQHTLWCWLF
jgi:hypothetical protein